MSDHMTLAAFACAFGLIFVLVAWSAWRTYTPMGVFLFALRFIAIGFGVACAVNSTLPSSAPRRTATGIISRITDVKKGNSHTYTVYLTTNDGRDLIFLAAAIPPFYAEGRDTVQVTYLDENSAGHPNRAIAFRALNGPHVGEGDSVSADWLGPWLGVVGSCLLGLVSIIAADRNKRTYS